MSFHSTLKKSIFKSEVQFQDTYKIIVIGDSTVGKTSFIKRLVKNEFLNTAPTIGVAYENKLVTIPDLNNYTVKLQIWDTAGSEKYKSVTTAHYRRAQGAVLMFDLSDLVSLQNCKNWLDEIRDHAGEDTVVMLVGNKSDLLPTHSPQDLFTFQKQHNLLCHQVSAKTAHNVKQTIEHLCKCIYIYIYTHTHIYIRNLLQKIREQHEQYVKEYVVKNK